MISEKQKSWQHFMNGSCRGPIDIAYSFWPTTLDPKPDILTQKGHWVDSTFIHTVAPF